MDFGGRTELCKQGRGDAGKRYLQSVFCTYESTFYVNLGGTAGFSCPKALGQEFLYIGEVKHVFVRQAMAKLYA